MKDYLNKLKNKKIAIVGLAKNNIPLIRFLIEKGINNITGCDKKIEKELEANLELSKMSIKLSLGDKYLENLHKFDFIFLSPGVPKDLSEIKKAKENGSEIASEMKLFFDLCPAKIIGVTGTNGKSTVVSLIGDILKHQAPNSKYQTVFVGGNIGQPLIDKLEKIQKEDIVVLELSSFQLEDLTKSPHIAVILNITPDHLDRHSNFSEYIKAKKNIIKYQKKNGWAVLNFDDSIVKNFQKEIEGNFFPFSKYNEFKEGVQVKNGYITVKNGNSEQKICSIDNLKLIGEHNLENVLAASAVAYLIGIKPKQIKKVVAKFSGLEHRLEFVSEINNVKFYNDSKATTPESTTWALKSFNREKVILIAGGYDKKVDFEKLASEIIDRKVKHLVLIGETAGKIENTILQQIPNSPALPACLAVGQAGRKFQISKCNNLEEAVKIAKKKTEPGDIVLFSPACASYDMFLNFEKRGRKFKHLIRKEK